MKYVSALDITESKVGLDAAYGTGYGSSHLSRRGARYVIGLAVSENALKRAEAYEQQYLHFIRECSYSAVFRQLLKCSDIF